MPKPVKKPLKPRKQRDANEAAFDAVQQAIRMAEEEITEPAPTFNAQLSAYMAKIGAKGGKIGGKKRLQTLTKERREEIALNAVRARWAKRKAKA